MCVRALVASYCAVPLAPATESRAARRLSLAGAKPGAKLGALSRPDSGRASSSPTQVVLSSARNRTDSRRRSPGFTFICAPDRHQDATSCWLAANQQHVHAAAAAANGRSHAFV